MTKTKTAVPIITKITESTDISDTENTATGRNQVRQVPDVFDQMYAAGHKALGFYRTRGGPT